MKTKILISLFVVCCMIAHGQTNYQTLETKIKDIIDTTWTFNIDVPDSTESVHKELAIIKSGHYFGIIKFHRKIIPNCYMEMIVFESTNDSILSSEIDNFHMYASCALPSNAEDYVLLDAKIKIGQFILFLPMYPCWRNGYSENKKLLIKQLIKKTEQI